MARRPFRTRRAVGGVQRGGRGASAADGKRDYPDRGWHRAVAEARAAASVGRIVAGRGVASPRASRRAFPRVQRAEARRIAARRQGVARRLARVAQGCQGRPQRRQGCALDGRHGRRGEGHPRAVRRCGRAGPRDARGAVPRPVAPAAFDSGQRRPPRQGDRSEHDEGRVDRVARRTGGDGGSEGRRRPGKQTRVRRVGREVPAAAAEATHRPIRAAPRRRAALDQSTGPAGDCAADSLGHLPDGAARRSRGRRRGAPDDRNPVARRARRHRERARRGRDGDDVASDGEGGEGCRAGRVGE
mmetsp:Transcript_4603/g.18974  ORF Transcript_4603/g.18974 Transcript_4603/m.18974 type:complete len:301 (+) Transcript_4603:1647-2549(+)